MTYFEKPTYVTNIHPCSSKFLSIEAFSSIILSALLMMKKCKSLFTKLKCNFSVFSFLTFNVYVFLPPNQAWKATKFSPFLLGELKGEGDEISLLTAITHDECRQRSTHLFPENKNLFGCPPGSHFWKSWWMFFYTSWYFSMGADNLWELRIMQFHVYLLCSQGIFRSLWDTALWLWAGQNVNIC